MKFYLDRFGAFFFVAALLLCACLAHAQTVSPFMGIGDAQFFDNNGNLLLAGVLYSYQAGTTNYQATYTDSTGLYQNPDPIPFGSGARVSIWLTSTANYKFVLCLQNDGASCAPADVLFSMDNVPGCLGCMGASSTFTGTFISGSPNPASTGILELASIDSICWRNAANNTNLCISKDTSDVLTWTGAVTKWPETSCSMGAVNEDYFCPNSATHHMSGNNNNAGYGNYPLFSLTPGIGGHLAGLQSNGIDLLDSGATPPASTAVIFSGTPTFAATSQDQLFTMTLTGNVTASTLTMTGLPAPSLVSLELTQDATGGRTFVYPSNMIGGIAPTLTAGAVTMQHFIWDGTNAYAVTLIPVLPAVQASSTTLVASPVSVPASTTTPWLTKTVTMPSYGCPCRVLASYGMFYHSGTSTGGVIASVSDGSVSFATGVSTFTSAVNGGAVNASALSTATYANSASVTFTANAFTVVSGGITVQQYPDGTTVQASYLNLNVMASN